MNFCLFIDIDVFHLWFFYFKILDVIKSIDKKDDRVYAVGITDLVKEEFMNFSGYQWTNGLKARRLPWINGERKKMYSFLYCVKELNKFRDPDCLVLHKGKLYFADCVTKYK